MTAYEKLAETINMASPGPNGKIVFIDSDGYVMGFHILDMKTPPAPVSVTMLFIDVCTRARGVTFEEAISRVGDDCLKAGIACYRLIHSTANGVLALREEYADEVINIEARW